jgi:hypothetical protein
MKTCKNGHNLDLPESYYLRSDGYKRCRLCEAAIRTNYKSKLKKLGVDRLGTTKVGMYVAPTEAIALAKNTQKILDLYAKREIAMPWEIEKLNAEIAKLVSSIKD